MLQSIKNKSAIITEASSGIGKATALALACEGGQSCIDGSFSGQTSCYLQRMHEV